MRMKNHVPEPRVASTNLALNASAFSGIDAPANETAETSTSFSSEGTLTPDSQQSEKAKMADPFNALTHGCLRQITDRIEVDQPVVQCVQIKPMNSQNGVERFRVVMSDSVNFMQGMLGQRKSHCVLARGVG